MMARIKAPHLPVVTPSTSPPRGSFSHLLDFPAELVLSALNIPGYLGENVPQHFRTTRRGSVARYLQVIRALQKERFVQAARKT